jgi:hypothetical protein
MYCSDAASIDARGPVILKTVRPAGKRANIHDFAAFGSSRSEFVLRKPALAPDQRQALLPGA